MNQQFFPRFLFAITFLLSLSLTSQARSDCRQALVLALDVSGSVDSREYRLQLGGLASALRHPEVVQAFVAMPSNPVHLAVFEWSSPNYQRLLLNWTPITDEAILLQIASRLENTNREPGGAGTALGTAMLHGASLLAAQSDCWKHTLDISGDGKNNNGPHPRDVRNSLDVGALTINALVIGSDTAVQSEQRQVELNALAAYFKAMVILGPHAFVETALGFDDYENAMVRKLKRELESPVLSALPINR